MRNFVIVSITVLMVASCAHMQTSTPWPTETPTAEDTALETSTPSPTGTQPTGTPTSCPMLEFSSKYHEIMPWIPIEQQMQDFIDWLWINDRSFTECNQDHPPIMTDTLTLKEVATMDTPAPGYFILYPKSDKTLRAMNDTGAEYIVGITSSSTTNTPTVTQTPTVTPTARPWIDWILGDEGEAPVLSNGTSLCFNAYSGLDYYFLVAPGASNISVVLKKYDYTPTVTATPTVTPTPFPCLAGFDTDSGTPRASVPSFNQPIHGEDGLWVWADDDGLHVGLVPTITPTPTATETPSPSPTETNTPEPTATETPALTATPTTGFCSVVVSGAGSTYVNGTYDYTGMSDGCGYYEQRVDPNYVICIDTTIIDPPNQVWVITNYESYYYKSTTNPCGYNWSAMEWITFDGSDDPPTTACE